MKGTEVVLVLMSMINNIGKLLRLGCSDLAFFIGEILSGCKVGRVYIVRNKGQ